MKTISSDYKDAIKTMGREIDAKVIYTINNEEIELSGDMLNSITPHYEGGILKSVMKQLDIDSNVDIPIGTILECKFGVFTGLAYEYISFGNYVVYSSEKQEDTKSYKLVCYDKMLYSMKDYEAFATYPISVRDYLDALCDHIGLDFASTSDNFVNYNRQIPSELFLDANGDSLEYTFRDVLDQIAEITASTICINDDDELEVRYINDTEDTIDGDFLKDVNVNFGQVYGPINTITFKRSADADAISLSRPIDLADNLKNEIAISDNQFINDTNRADYISAILNQLYGLTYSINDFVSTGITYYDLCDKYNILIEDEENNTSTTYTCIMLNDEIEITQGLVENIHTDLPEDSETDYKTTTKDDRNSTRTNLIVDKVNNQITSVVSKTEVLDLKVNGGTEYKLTEDTTFEENKEYFIKSGDNYVEYPQYQEYLDERTGNPSSLGLYQAVYDYYASTDTEFNENNIYFYENDGEYLLATPINQSLYELEGGSYVATSDTEFDTTKTYYYYDGEDYVEASPIALDLYEQEPQIASYELTEDTTFIADKDYYIKQYDIGDTITANTYYEEIVHKGVDEEYRDITTELALKADLSKVNTIETSVNTLQTNTYSKTQVQEIANGTGYFKSEDTQFGATTIYYTKSGDNYVVYTGARTGSPKELGLYEFGLVSAVVSTEATFDKNGMRYTKSNGITESLINLNGLEVDNLTRNATTGAIESRDIGLYAGYVPNDATFVGDLYKGQTIVYTKNLISRGYTEVGVHGRFEEYAGPNSEDGVGFFVI